MLQSWKRRGLLLVALCVGVGACDKGGPLGGIGGGAKLDPKDAKWKDRELTIGKASAKFFMTGSGDGDPLFMKGYFDGFPPGTEIEVAGTKGTTNEGGHLALDIDMKKKIGSMSVRDVTNKDVDLDVTVKIEAPDSEAIEEDLPAMRIEPAVGAALAKVRDAALTFEGEPADDGKVGGAALVKVGGTSNIKIIGAADKIWDIDWIAVEEKKESGRKESCGGYEKVKGNIEVTQVDSLVKIIDRRSGKVIEQKTFQPKEPCPSFAMVSSNKKAKAFVHDTAIEPWVREVFDKNK